MAEQPGNIAFGGHMEGLLCFLPDELSLNKHYHLFDSPTLCPADLVGSQMPYCHRRNISEGVQSL